jgi:hypothetical protein
MFIGGLWDHEPLIAVLGAAVAVYGIYRIAQYASI